MKTLPTGLFLLTLGAAINLSSVQAARQEHMEEALSHLRAARTELQRAEPNKEGHRERAMEAVNRAIAQVEEGIRFAH
jgi:1,2-phenylacetyl-CoA epoxidase catalytic subunit